MSRRLLLALVPFLLAAQTLDEKIEEAARASLVARRTFWGLHAIDVSTGEPVYSFQGDRFFVPASNTKLFATALALTRLGPHHRFSTLLVSDGEIDRAGTLHGNLRLIGGGDPTLSGRPVPYDQSAKFGDPLSRLDLMALEAWLGGLRRVAGDVIGDDTAYQWEPYPPGWSQDDTIREYGAPVSALVLHDNTVRVEVRAGAGTGAPAEVQVTPAVSYFTIESHVLTGDENRVRVSRGDQPRLLTLWGSVRRGDGVSVPVAVPDPAHYAAQALRDALERRGVVIQGGVKARHRYPWQTDPPAAEIGRARVLACRDSPMLIDLLKIVNKVSQNLHAEIMMREVARARGPAGSRTAGLREMGAFLRSVGIGARDVNLVDASGLSRLTLATPEAFTRLLRAMYNGPHRDQWLDTLPLGGEDGTLRGRFRGLAGARVMAKTGSLTHVNALSGYVSNSRGQVLAFSMIINNANNAAPASRAFIDKVVGLLAE